MGRSASTCISFELVVFFSCPGPGEKTCGPIDLGLTPGKARNNLGRTKNKLTQNRLATPNLDDDRPTASTEVQFQSSFRPSTSTPTTIASAHASSREFALLSRFCSYNFKPWQSASFIPSVRFQQPPTLDSIRNSAFDPSPDLRPPEPRPVFGVAGDLRRR